MLFNEALPEDYRFVNYQVPKKELGAIVNDLAERYPKVHVAASLDALKSAGFHWATRAGITIAIDDVVTPPAKQEILDRHEAEARQIEKQYERGVITDAERRGELIEIWTRARAEVRASPVFHSRMSSPFGRSLASSSEIGRGWASSLPASTRHGVVMVETNARSTQYTKPGP